MRTCVKFTSKRLRSYIKNAFKVSEFSPELQPDGAVFQPERTLSQALNFELRSTSRASSTIHRYRLQFATICMSETSSSTPLENTQSHLYSRTPASICISHSVQVNQRLGTILGSHNPRMVRSVSNSTSSSCSNGETW